jgi:hypothetical protein
MIIESIKTLAILQIPLNIKTFQGTLKVEYVGATCNAPDQPPNFLYHLDLIVMFQDAIPCPRAFSATM